MQCALLLGNGFAIRMDEGCQNMAAVVLPKMLYMTRETTLIERKTFFFPPFTLPFVDKSNKSVYAGSLRAASLIRKAVITS